MKTAKELIDEANCGFIGLNTEGEVSHGYDSRVESARMPLSEDFDPEYDGPPMPPEERVKLANEMIARWTAYRFDALSACAESAINKSSP